jgi:hypothetical protein
MESVLNKDIPVIQDKEPGPGEDNVTQNSEKGM